MRRCTRWRPTGVKRLPVIENHRLVGMITEADLAHKLNGRWLAEFVEKVYTAA